jgi:FkbM family methyltransferase
VIFWPDTPPEGIIRTKEGVHVLEHDSHLSRWVEEHGRLDIAEKEIERFAKYIPDGGVVVDAGANIGDHTMTYAKLVGPTGRVAAFEPNPLCYQALALNFELWKTVVPIKCGLAAREQKAWLQREENVGASYLVESDGKQEDEVRCAPLDEMLREIHRLDFIHLDCEGWELSALQGMRELLTRFRPVLVIEINKGCLARAGTDPHAIYQFLISLVYRWEELAVHPNPEDLEQRDILAIPRDR